MEKWEAEMRQAEDAGDALLVMETALIEVDRLRQQLAAAEESASAVCQEWDAKCQALEARIASLESALESQDRTREVHRELGSDGAAGVRPVPWQ